MPTKTKTTKKPKLIAAADVSKKDTVLRLLRRQNGASIAELAEATVRKKLELPLVSTKEVGGERRYHIAALKPAKE